MCELDVIGFGVAFCRVLSCLSKALDLTVCWVLVDLDSDCFLWSVCVLARRIGCVIDRFIRCFRTYAQAQHHPRDTGLE